MRIIFLVLAAACSLYSQSPSTPRASFDVASVKPASSAVAGKGEGGSISLSPNLTLRNVSLFDVVLAAYGIQEYQLSGPGWMKSESYDIVAKAGDGATTAQIREMLQGLLAERFKLAIHRDTKELSVQSMTVGKNGAKLGPRKPEGAASIGRDNGRMVFRNYTMPQFAAFLSRGNPGGPIADKTAIEGCYDFSVQLQDVDSGDERAVKMAMERAMRDGSMAWSFAAQLGLTIETRKGPVEIVVVDRVEKIPTEN
jgi:uncharacterized protein (TIGR03435 family)